MKIAVLALVIAGELAAQVQVLPNVSFPAARVLINNNFSWLNTHKETLDPNILRSSQFFTNPSWLSLTATGGRITGLGGAALLNVGAAANTVAAGDDSRFNQIGSGSGVPYTGATQDVDLGSHSIKAASFNGPTGSPLLIEGAEQAKPAPPAGANSQNCYFLASGHVFECQDHNGTVIGRVIDPSVVVPYTGANANLDMGAHTISAAGFVGPSGTAFLMEGAEQAKPTAPLDAGSQNCWFDLTSHMGNCQDSSGTITAKFLNTTTPSTNHAVCWKDSKTLGYCSDTPGAGGACTCN